MSREALDAALRDMDREDRLAALVLAIIDADNDALEISLRMLNALLVMSRRQSLKNKFRIGDALRDVADRLENVFEPTAY